MFKDAIRQRKRIWELDDNILNLLLMQAFEAKEKINFMTGYGYRYDLIENSEIENVCSHIQLKKYCGEENNMSLAIEKYLNNIYAIYVSKISEMCVKGIYSLIMNFDYKRHKDKITGYLWALSSDNSPAVSKLGDYFFLRYQLHMTKLLSRA